MADLVALNSEELTQGIAEAIAAAREAGRREVLREIARLPEPIQRNVPPAEFKTDWVPVDVCQWCHMNDDDSATGYIPHKPTCLWLRAQEATKE